MAKSKEEVINPTDIDPRPIQKYLLEYGQDDYADHLMILADHAYQTASLREENAKLKSELEEAKKEQERLKTFLIEFTGWHENGWKTAKTSAIIKIDGKISIIKISDSLEKQRLLSPYRKNKNIDIIKLQEI